MESELRTLFEAGTVVGRSDDELLDRFLAAGGPAAELAFSALVERHGPMVWRVCRDVLRESNDADDAFQATFLVLVRRAGAIRKRSSLGPWLYGVALRVARCARTSTARRRKREQIAAEAEPERAESESVLDVDRLDVAPILHEEVDRLPAKFRSPLVLCYFEGLTHDQAASQLGWPVGTVRSRLAEARDRLRPRLLRRGVGPPVAILAVTDRAEAAGQAKATAKATVPAALASATVRMALGAGAAGTVPAGVAALVGIALGEMNIMKLSMIATGLLATTLAGTAGVGYVAVSVAARPQDAEKTVPLKPYDPALKSGAAGPLPTPIAPGREGSSPHAPGLRPGAGPAPVVWARLAAAAERFRVAQAAHAAARLQYDHVIEARSELVVLAAELNTCADDLRDELDLLQAQLEIRKADVLAAEAQVAKVALSHSYTKQLVDKKVVSPTELSSIQTDVDFRSAELAKKKAELNEVMLRIKQATRRRDEAIALATRARGLVPEPEPNPGPAAPHAEP